MVDPTLSYMAWTFAVLIVGGIIYLYYGQYKKEGTQDKNSPTRGRSQLYLKHTGIVTIKKVDRLSKDRIRIFLDNGRNFDAFRDDIKPIDIGQVICGSRPALFVYDPQGVVGPGDVGIDRRTSEYWRGQAIYERKDGFAKLRDLAEAYKQRQQTSGPGEGDPGAEL